jgi:hypothetical protein
MKATTEVLTSARHNTYLSTVRVLRVDERFILFEETSVDIFR